ncbi:CotS family spore coat protein [Clostridium sp.]|uniref:CotS family spore coat protein n=1 Tax=Clostridium sp. TaxID=1506 RepID=UPI0032166110
MNNVIVDNSTIDLLSTSNIKKNVLPYYDLSRDSAIYQVKFKDTDKQRAVYKIESNGHEYCLKKVYYQVDELLFIYSATEWLYRNNINVPRILSTSDHGRYVNYNNMLFILTDWLQGDKCDFDNIDNVNMASRNLGNMHEISLGFSPILGSKHKEGLSNLAESLNKHTHQLVNFEKLSLKYKDYFSKVYMLSFTTSMTLATLATNIANTIDTSNLSKSICHNDYVSKNLIVNQGEIFVIDFDKCKYDYCALDISYCLRRLLRRENTCWNGDLAINFLQQYEINHPLTLDDYKYILSYLAFPQKYWKLSRDYYNNISRCNKKSFVNLLNKAVCNNDIHIDFSYKLLKYIELKFGVKL